LRVPEDDLKVVIKNSRGVLLFNAVFIPVLLLCLGVTAYFVQKEFRQLAEQQVLENPHLMMETAKASRIYTTEQIDPLLTHEETRVADGVKNLNDVINKQFPLALQQAVSGLSHGSTPDTQRFFLWSISVCTSWRGARSSRDELPLVRDFQPAHVFRKSRERATDERELVPTGQRSPSTGAPW
jgi:hypothetical protein